MVFALKDYNAIRRFINLSSSTLRVACFLCLSILYYETLPEPDCSVGYDLSFNLCQFIFICSCISSLLKLKYFFFLVLNPPLTWARKD